MSSFALWSPRVWYARWRTYRSWSGTQRRLIREAYALLCLYRFLVFVLPFWFLTPRMGWYMAETLQQRLAIPVQDQADAIAWAVRRMSVYTPRTSTCLVQALAAQNMLKRRGLGSTLYLGMVPGGQSATGTEAHAWLRCGTSYLTGQEEMGDFHPVACYAMDTRVRYRPVTWRDWGVSAT